MGQYSNIIKKFLCFIVIIGLYSSALCNTAEANQTALKIIATQLLKPTNEGYLRSNPTKVSRAPEKMYEPASNTPLFIVLHYTVTPTVEETIEALYAQGFSAHFTVDKDGVIYEHVPRGNIAYHAGLSFWHGKYGLNEYSIGIEQINVGWNVDRKTWKNTVFPKEADGKKWETWPEVQIKSAAALVQSLLKYDIKSWNIIGHSDCSCGRKVDPGPLFPWKKLYSEYHIGFWPAEDASITKELANGLSSEDYIFFLHVFGYPIHGFISSIENIEELKARPDRFERMKGMDNNLSNFATIAAFQYHYLQNKFEDDPLYKSGELDDDTQIMILRCIKSILSQCEKTDYSFRKIKELYEADKFTKPAKQLIKEFAEEIHSEL